MGVLVGLQFRRFHQTTYSSLVSRENTCAAELSHGRGLGVKMGNFFARVFGGNNNNNNERVGQEQPPAPKGPSRVSEQDRAVLVSHPRTCKLTLVSSIFERVSYLPFKHSAATQEAER